MTWLLYPSKNGVGRWLAQLEDRSRARLQLGCVLLWHPAGVSGVPGLPSSTIHVVLVLTLELLRLLVMQHVRQAAAAAAQQVCHICTHLGVQGPRVIGAA